jgi:predicted Zn-dependent protease
MSYGQYGGGYQQFGPGGHRASAIMRLAPLIIMLVPAIAMMARGCQEGPFGRRQIVGMSPQEESQLGAQAFQQVLQQNFNKILPDSDPAVMRVREIGENLKRAAYTSQFQKATKIPLSDFKDFQWVFKVVQENQLNAFCLPGGKVVVYTGILPVCANDAGLATVMGHEIAHALAHHGSERMAQQQLVRLGQAAVASSFGDMDYASQQRLMSILAAGANMGILLPFSRKHESEADKVGLFLMAMAGYDPHEAAEFWKRMQAAGEKGGGQRPPEFLSTHPGSERRAADLRMWSKEVMPFYEASARQPGERRLPVPGQLRPKGFR